MRAHFIGIGGIGVSALAKYYLRRGFEVSGSDLVESEVTRELKKQGAKVFIGKHRAQHVPQSVDLIVYSPAVRPNNPELKKGFSLLKRNPSLKILSYPQALGELTKKYFTIAICGTHGKSTTTSLVGLILKKAKLDPTVIVGTKVREFQNSNCRIGKGKYLVVEADEHFESFLNYWPKVVVLTSLEPDHLDYYQNFSRYKKAFLKFIFHLPSEGWLVANRDDPEVFLLAKNRERVKFYSLKERVAKKIKKILKVPGDFNVANALAALKVAKILKIKEAVCFSVFKSFRGTWRRFQLERKEIDKKRVFVVHDYAHHPTEVLFTLKAAREKFGKKRIFAIFQPHQYQRTFYLWKDFLEKLPQAPVDRMVVVDIYSVAGRESLKIKKKVCAKKLVEELKKQDPQKFFYCPSVNEALSFFKKELKEGDVLCFLGAGDIYQMAKNLIK